MKERPEAKRVGEKKETIASEHPEQPGLQTPTEQPEVLRVQRVPIGPEVDVGNFISEQEKITRRKREEEKKKRPELDS